MKRAELPPELREATRQGIHRTLVSLAKYVDAHRLRAKMPREIAQEMHADLVAQLEALYALANPQAWEGVIGGSRARP